MATTWSVVLGTWSSEHMGYRVKDQRAIFADHFSSAVCRNLNSHYAKHRKPNTKCKKELHSFVSLPLWQIHFEIFFSRSIDVYLDLDLNKFCNFRAGRFVCAGSSSFARSGLQKVPNLLQTTDSDGKIKIPNGLDKDVTNVANQVGELTFEEDDEDQFYIKDLPKHACV